MSDLNVYTTSAINALTPITGDMVVDSDLNAVKLYDGAAWRTFNSDSVAVPFDNEWGASFDGSGDYLTTDNTVLNFYNTGGSISAWIKPSSVTATLTDAYKNRSIINKGNVYLSLNIDESGYPVLYFYDGAVREVVATTQVSTSSWMHICATWSTTGSSIYVNGTSEATSTDTPANINSSHTETTVYMGRAPTAWDYYGGLIDELAVFNTALSGPDITKIYNGTAPNGKPTDLTLAGSYDTDRTANLKGYWRMGDDSNDSPSSDPASNKIVTITDSSGNGNDATQGAASYQPTFSDLTGETIYA